MQKTKRIILTFLGIKPSTIPEIRKHFKDKFKATNSAELARQMKILEANNCVINNSGVYSITDRGLEMLEILEGIGDIFKQ